MAKSSFFSSLLGHTYQDLKKFKGTKDTATSGINLFKKSSWKLADGIYARLRMPVAVYASRSNRRIRTQSGVFTLHGGKYVPKPQDYEAGEVYDTPIGMPIGLFEINADKRILKWLRIPKLKREGFRRTLAQIGVTDASLFPELDYQSKYLLTRWTFQEPADDAEEE